jgi:hypothetical protein
MLKQEIPSENIQNKILLTYLTRNKHDFISIPFFNKEKFIKEFYYEINKYFEYGDFKKNEIDDILLVKKEIFDCFFYDIEKKTNMFIVKKFLYTLSYDMKKEKHVIKYKKNDLSNAISQNLRSFNDITFYYSVNDFLQHSYERKLQPFSHNYKFLTVYDFSHYYYEEFDYFIYQEINVIFKKYLKNDSFDLKNTNFGRNILQILFSNISENYLSQIFNLPIKEFFGVFNIPFFEKCLEHIEDQYIYQKKEIQKEINLIKNIHKMFIKLFKKNINEVFINQNSFDIVKKQDIKNISYYFFHLVKIKKEFNFSIIESTFAKNTYQYNSFLIKNKKVVSINSIEKIKNNENKYIHKKKNEHTESLNYLFHKL